MNYQYFVYILLCADKSYYTGITNNLSKRFNEHQAGTKRDSYTYSRRPLTLVFQQEFNDVIQAIYFEKKIKGWSRAKKKALIDGDFDRLQILSECRNVSHYKFKPRD
ncbi:GIY-YIG nuclease family protein [Winogradskyella ludwigii]|uniref:GIY-YIG nuclease family protein n=1 Tax=Winogradskyella ludwigii TaxID=2686076 RepID=UPI0015CB42E7|nr:GIY-YIG nuclease family protein [Winogradskyella ludwigii]